MRDLKFRAWDDESKEMFYSKVEQYDDSLSFRFKHFDTDEPIYMQYTGLKDKNGKEIYEGDLITITNPFTNHETIGVAEVVFSYEYVGGWVAQSEDSHLNVGTRTHMVSVVGNTYEHPHLLKEVK